MGSDDGPDPGAEQRTGATGPAAEREQRRRERRAAEERIRQQGTWVDLQIQQAVARGEFDRLPGHGKPLRLPDRHDPDWWVKRLVERERITVLPPALQLRRTDAELDDRLDRLAGEQQVRDAVVEFNDQVRRTLYSTWGGPPVVTAQRDVEEEVRRWRARLDDRRAAHRAARDAASHTTDHGGATDGGADDAGDASPATRSRTRRLLARWRRR